MMVEAGAVAEPMAPTARRRKGQLKRKYIVAVTMAPINIPQGNYYHSVMAFEG